MKRVLIILAASMTAVAGEQDQKAAPSEEADLRALLTIRRVYVDQLTGGLTAAQMRDILVSSLAGTKLFVVTENPERADATFKGAAEDLIFTETRGSSEGLNAHMNAGVGRTSSTQRGANTGFGIGDTESEHSTDRRHEAIASLRLVNKDGDVIWSTTQESQGAKFHGASADVAEKIMTRLKDDVARARRLASAPAPAPASKL